MKKKFIKAMLIGLTAAASGAVVTAPAVMSQTAITAEAAENYEINRYITFYWKQADGSTSVASQGAYQRISVSDPAMQVTFAAADAHNFISGIPAGWKIENPDIPSVKASYNNPPAEVKIYLVPDEESASNAVRVVREVNIYKKHSDGRKELVGSVGQQSSPLLDKDQVVSFPATTATSFLEDYDTGAWSPWEPEDNNVPAASGSYNNPPKAHNIYLVINTNSGTEQAKTVTRTVKYFKKDLNGNKSQFKTYTDSVTFPAGSSNTMEYTFKDINVEALEGYTVDRTVVKGRKVTPTSNDFVEEVVYTKNPNVTTEEKTVWRWVNFIDKDTGKKIRGSEAKGVKFTREVYKDANGQTVVVRDWQKEGTIPEHPLPDVEGYSHAQQSVPAQKVNANTEDFEVDVYYTSTRFTVNYHKDDNSSASSKKTVVDYGTWTDTLTTSALGFSKPNSTFSGWKLYREIDDSWYLKDSDGNKKWMKLNNGNLPSGYEFVLYKDGQKVKIVAKRGNVHFYGQWRENIFTVNYHLDDNSGASGKTTSVIYGTWTKTLTTSDLGFSKPNSAFIGWKLYREIDDSWYLKDSSGNKKWMKLNNGNLPSGYEFVIYSNGQKVKALAKTGNTHLYGQWQERKFTVKYHLDEKSSASSKTTSVVYGNLTKTLTAAELGFKKTGKTFVGWKVYREIDDSWYLKDDNGNKKWMKLENGKLPADHSFYICKDGQSVKAVAKSGNAHFYGQWK